MESINSSQKQKVQGQSFTPSYFYKIIDVKAKVTKSDLTELPNLTNEDMKSRK